MEDLQAYFRGLRLDREANHDISDETSIQVFPMPVVCGASASVSPSNLHDSQRAALPGDSPEQLHAPGDESEGGELLSSNDTAPLIQLAEVSTSSHYTAAGWNGSLCSQHATSSSATGVPLLGFQQPAHVFGRNVLVLDLDETLVHSSQDNQHFAPEQGDRIVVVELPSGGQQIIYVKLRPHVETFLRQASALFEVVVFTAGVHSYAEAVMRSLDPHRDYHHHLLTRHHCTLMDSAFVKDLSFLGRPLSRVIIVDNSPVAYVLQPRNAVPCTSWFGDPGDCELLEILQLLQHCAVCPDVFAILDPYHQLLESVYYSQEEA